MDHKHLLRRVVVSLKWTILWVEIVAILLLASGLAVAALAFKDARDLIPSDDFIQNFTSPEGTQIWSADGQLLARLAVEHRELVKYRDIPQVMLDAIVAIEDQRFHDHHGIDLRGVARAVVANISAGDLTQQGASTITQQLARNIYLSPRKTVTRKLRETLLAIEIERNWTKPKILETYLNQVFFGAGAYGIQAASQVYFKKDVGDLTLPEAALLAGLPQRPTSFNPYRVRRQDKEMTLCKNRRNAVLNRMESGGMISADEAEKARQTPIKLGHSTAPQLGGYYQAHHFVDYVVQKLINTYGEDMVLKGGLNVHTTIHSKMQAAAELACKNGLKQRGKRYRVGEMALICLDPHTGYIRAMVGGASKPWSQQQFNCAVQAKRQPGSSFKFFVYGTALEQGWSTSKGVKVDWIPMRDGANKFWVVRNHGRYRTGTLTMLRAFASSINTCAANTILAVGPGEVVEFAHRLGIKSKLAPVPSLALGSSEVTVLEMAVAYGAIAAGGRRAEPMAIIRVEAGGKILEEHTPTVTKLNLKGRTINGLTRLTRAVVTSGTGRVVRGVPDAHGKTGTTDDYKDAWFVGFTADLVTAVWGGNLDNTPMRRGYGGTISAPVWAEFMKKAVKLNPAKPHKIVQLKEEPLEKEEEEAKEEQPELAPQPDRGPTADQARAILGADSSDSNLIRVRICSETGFVATVHCPAVSEDQYFSGSQPTTSCDLHTAAASPPSAPDDSAAGDDSESGD